MFTLIIVNCNLIISVMAAWPIKGLGAIRAKIGPTSDVDKIFSKMYSQYVLFINNCIIMHILKKQKQKQKQSIIKLNKQSINLI